MIAWNISTIKLKKHFTLLGTRYYLSLLLNHDSDRLYIIVSLFKVHLFMMANELAYTLAYRYILMFCSCEYTKIFFLTMILFKCKIIIYRFHFVSALLMLLIHFFQLGILIKLCFIFHITQTVIRNSQHLLFMEI